MIFPLLVFAPSTDSDCESDDTTEPDLERSSEPPHERYTFFQRLKTLLKKRAAICLAPPLIRFHSMIGQGQPLARKLVVWQLRTQQET